VTNKEKEKLALALSKAKDWKEESIERRKGKLKPRRRKYA